LFDELAEKYKFTGAFLNSNSHQIPDKTVKMFLKKKEWIPVYFNYDALILLKDIPQNKDLIGRFRIDFKTWTPPDFDLRKLGSKPISPLLQINRAYTLVSMEYYDLALREMDMAAKVAPQSVEIYKLRGKIYEAQKKYEQAFINYRIASSMFPLDMDLRGKLALAYENRGDYDYAIEHIEKIVRYAPSDARGFYSMSRCFARAGKIEKAREYLRKAIVMDPDNSVELLKIGDIMYQQKEYERALAIYTKALYGSKELGKVHYKIGLAHLVLRNYDQAKVHFEKSITAAPDDQYAKKAKKKLSKLTLVKSKKD
jgi:tetratricopeptide (TPR) repeat protein